MTRSTLLAWVAAAQTSAQRNPAVVVAATSAVAAANAFVLNILTARSLGPELRGNVAFVLQICYFLAPILTLGSDRGAVKTQGTATPPRLRAMVTTTCIFGVVLFLVAPEWIWLAGPIALANAFLALNRADVLTGSPLRHFAVPALSYQFFVLGCSVALFVFGIKWWPAWALPYLLPLPLMVPRMLRARDSSAITPWRANVLLLLGRLCQLTVLRSQRIWLPVIAGPASLGLFAVVATATEPSFGSLSR